MLKIQQGACPRGRQSFCDFALAVSFLVDSTQRRIAVDVRLEGTCETLIRS